MSRVPIVLILGDAALCATLADQFAHAGLRSVAAQVEADALSILAAEAPDALLIDDAHMSACAFLPRARASGFCGAALIVAAEPSPALGAHGVCLTRPLRFAELLAHIEALGAAGEAPADAAVGPFRFRARTCELIARNGDRIRLTEKEAAILAALAQAQGATVSREALLRDIWSVRDAVSTHRLQTHVHRLRRKLEAGAGTGHSLLLTEKGGYRLARQASGD